MLWEDAMSKQQKPESSGNELELRNHIREQCFSCFYFLLQTSHLLNPFESNGTLRNQQSCFELKFLLRRSVELIGVMFQCFRTPESAKNQRKIK